jgi:LDH2 family malate/lactate/ureidoglycolate dehydrogenase
MNLNLDLQMFNYSQLMKFCISVFTSLDMDDEKAHDTSEILIEADMMGHSTHGVRLLPLYIRDIEMGNMKVKGEEVVIKDFVGSVTIDGKNLPGIWLTKKALKLASKRAKKFGTATVLIRNSHHNGALATYMLPIVNKGLIGIIKSSVPSTATVAPFGGTKALLSPDPMALAYPTNNKPVIIDISASITTNNMIADKISKKELFDFDCLLTSEGTPTNDPLEVQNNNGTVMPIGGLQYGHKGFGLALGIEALSQGLSGSGRSKKPKSMNLSTFVQVIDPEAFSGLAAFKDEMTFLSRECIDNPAIDKNNKVRMPGEKALLRRENAIRYGIKLSRETLENLENIAQKFKIKL